LSSEELESFYEALDKTLRKQYPDEEEGWYGVSARENAHEALRALRDRLQEARELSGTATSDVLEEELQALPPSVTASQSGKGHHHKHQKKSLMLTRLRKRVGEFITGIHLNDLLAATKEEPKGKPHETTPAAAAAAAAAAAGGSREEGKAKKRDADDEDSEDDEDDELPPAYEDHELPESMPLNYASHFIASRLGPADLPAFSVFFEHTIQGEKAASWEVY
jgi:hypothetical protein